MLENNITDFFFSSRVPHSSHRLLAGLILEFVMIVTKNEQG